MPDVANYIEEMIRSLLERPHMYANDAKSCEGLLQHLDDIREFAIDGVSREERGASAYTNFLIKEGFDAAGVTGHFKTDEELQLPEGKAFADLYHWWSIYLNDALRPSS